MLFTAVSLFAAAAFAVGFFWRYDKGGRSITAARAAERSGPANSEALRLLDEAVRARYEKRWQDARNALDEARHRDASLRGVDILSGEIALEQGDAETLLEAAREALSRRENAASANLLLALQTWMQRSEAGMSASADSAKRYFADAAEIQPSSAPVHFFRGEVNRLLGENVEAFRNLQSALHRFNPWDSSAVISAKAAFVSTEANRPVAVAPPDPSSPTRAAASASETRKAQGGASLQAPAPHTSQPALRGLASDPRCYPPEGLVKPGAPVGP